MTQMIEAWWKRLVIDEKRQKEKYGWEWEIEREVEREKERKKEREKERKKERERGSKNKRSWVEGYMKK